MNRKRLRGAPHNPGVRNLVQAKCAWSRALAREKVESGFLGWHGSGYLPHQDEPGLVEFVTFRLTDAFPEEFRPE
ncbi:MAG: hypothetical protein DVB33_01470 [Verrucomicrobia bacterium]|nr:MAG: hypothetical protein DVB33_01470 [Verrucomicrobiota bacterium]